MYKGAQIFVFGGIFGGILGTIFGVLVGSLLGFFGGAVFWEYNDKKDREKGYSRYHQHGMSTPPRPGWQADDLDEVDEDTRPKEPTPAT